MSSTSPVEDVTIRVPVSCLAEFVTSPGRSAESLIRPYKFNKRGEGFARSSYYQLAIAAIRSFHANGNEPKVFERALFDLRKRADATEKQFERVRLQKNIKAIEAYQRIYKDRRFTVLANHRIEYRIGQLIVRAQPDLWVAEIGTQVLLKIGVSKKKASYVDILLTVMRKAAVSGGYRVRAKNVVYLNVSTGEELICTSGLTRFNRTFEAKAQEIANLWPQIHPTASI